MTSTEKFLYSVSSALIFILVSNKSMYKMIDEINKEPILIRDNCPTIMSHFIQSIIFFILILVILMLLNSTRNNIWTLVKYAFYSTLLYFILTSSEMYGLIGIITNNTTSDSFGCPNFRGTLLHGLFYFLIIFGIIFFK